MISLVVSVVVEIPTGALSDLIGKKHTLLMSFVIAGFFELFIAFSSSYVNFVIAWAGLALGYSFYSGTMQAFMYDTLASNNLEKHYSHVVSRSEAVTNIAIAIASVGGGYLFGFWVGLPFLITGLLKLFGAVVALFLDEPQVDTDTFSWNTFLQQTKKGFSSLLDDNMIHSTLLLLLFGSFSVVAYEILDDAAVVNWGLGAVEIGYLYSIATAIAVPATFLYAGLSRRFSHIHLVMVSLGILALNYAFSPWISSSAWIGLFLFRVFYSPIKNSAISELINENTPSKIRATTLSTYELLKKLPFVLLSGFIGSSLETNGVKMFSFWFSSLLVGLFILYLIFLRLSSKSS